jgi:hypothetical protein
VIAYKLGVPNRRERVIDLKIEQVLDPAAAHVVNRAANPQGRHRSAMTIGTQEQRILFREQQLPSRRIDRRHRPLAKQHHIRGRHAEIVVLLQERLLLFVRHRTRHHVERHRRPVPPRGRYRSFEMDLQQRSIRYGPDRKQPLGLIEPQPAPLPACHKQHADLPCR